MGEEGGGHMIRTWILNHTCHFVHIVIMNLLMVTRVCPNEFTQDCRFVTSALLLHTFLNVQFVAGLKVHHYFLTKMFNKLCYRDCIAMYTTDFIHGTLTRFLSNHDANAAAQQGSVIHIEDEGQGKKVCLMNSHT